MATTCPSCGQLGVPRWPYLCGDCTDHSEWLATQPIRTQQQERVFLQSVPAILGGQGRTGESVRHDGLACACVLLGLIVVAGTMVLLYL